MMSTQNETAPSDLWFLGSRVRMHLAQEENAARISLVEHRIPEGFSPPRHIHLDEDETFYVLEGELVIEAGEARRTVRAGQAAHAPRGVAHSFRVVSPGGARCLTVSTGGFEAFVRTVSQPAVDEGLPGPAPIDADVLTEAAGRHGILFVGPPIAA
jgi:quercetin dioxygenase-like cupin family protein